MGEIRGKRNRDQDRYWHARRKWTQFGMAGAPDAQGVCTKCGLLTPREQMYKGWCFTCVAKWTDTADPWLVYQAQSHLPVGLVRPATVKQAEQIAAFVAEPLKDDDFLPLTQFFGGCSIGHHRSMWNFLHAMYTMELETTAEARKLGIVCPNTVHLCGRHAPVERMSIEGHLSRIKSAGDDFKLWKRDRRFTEYVRGFAADNRLRVGIYRRTSIDVFARAAKIAFEAKYGKTKFDKHSPEHWPFEAEHEAKAREEGALEELPDYVMEIGKLVSSSGTPKSLREDLCQDLVIAVLSGEVPLEDLRNESVMKHYVRQVFQHHPLKYGRYSLDNWSSDDNENWNSPLNRLTSEDLAPRDRGWQGHPDIQIEHVPHGWHEGRNRERGVATLGDIARFKTGGYAVQGPNVIQTSEDMDEEIADVFYAETHPAWRRRLND